MKTNFLANLAENKTGELYSDGASGETDGNVDDLTNQLRKTGRERVLKLFPAMVRISMI